MERIADPRPDLEHHPLRAECEPERRRGRARDGKREHERCPCSACTPRETTKNYEQHRANQKPYGSSGGDARTGVATGRSTLREGTNEGS